ncbi:MAG TPA: hypothetical protein VGH65_09085 [Verrucomicrobiaceae bacterium]
MKGLFSGWSSDDVVAMTALLAVIVVFAFFCLPRPNLNHQLFSVRLVLVFLASAGCATSAWFKLEAVTDDLNWMGTPLLPLEARPTIHLTQDRLTGGFIILVAMSIIHGVLWFSQRRKVLQ